MIDGTRMTDFRPIVERILLSRKRSSKVGVYGGPSLADVGKAGSRGANGKGVMGKGGLGGAGATEDLRPTPSTAVEGRVFEASVEVCARVAREEGHTRRRCRLLVHGEPAEPVLCIEFCSCPEIRWSKRQN